MLGNTGLRGQNQFAVLGQPQPVLAAFVFDNQFATLAQQFPARYPTAEEGSKALGGLISLRFQGRQTALHL
jgi:hypothetical protein